MGIYPLACYYFVVTSLHFGAIELVNSYTVSEVGWQHDTYPQWKSSILQPDAWQKWPRRFDRFRQASGIDSSVDSKSEESQVNALVYSMGDKADDIQVVRRGSKEIRTVTGPFTKYFVKRSTQFSNARSSTDTNRRKVNLWTVSLLTSSA